LDFAFMVAQGSLGYKIQNAKVRRIGLGKGYQEEPHSILLVGIRAYWG
jgi:hypothetical protein